MKDFIGLGGESQAEITAILTSNSDGVERMKFIAEFSDEKLAEKQEEFVETSVELEKLRDEKKAIVKTISDQIKPLEADFKKLLTEVKNKGEKRDEDTYMIIDTDEKKMLFYSKEGYLVHFRRLGKNEQPQQGLFKLNKGESIIAHLEQQSEKTGTDDQDYKFATKGPASEDEPAF